MNYPQFLKKTFDNMNMEQFIEATKEYGSYDPANPIDPITITAEIWEMADDILTENLVDAEIQDIIISGSRARGLDGRNSDLDIIITYIGEIKEDALFNILNEEEHKYCGIKVDFNPYKAEETDINELLTRVDNYLEEKKERYQAFCQKPTFDEDDTAFFMLIGKKLDINSVLSFLDKNTTPEIVASLTGGKCNENKTNEYTKIIFKSQAKKFGPEQIYSITKDLNCRGFADTNYDKTETYAANNGEKWKDFDRTIHKWEKNILSEERVFYNIDLTLTDPESRSDFTTGGEFVTEEEKNKYIELIGITDFSIIESKNIQSALADNEQKNIHERALNRAMFSYITKGHEYCSILEYSAREIRDALLNSEIFMSNDIKDVVDIEILSNEYEKSIVQIFNILDEGDSLEDAITYIQKENQIGFLETLGERYSIDDFTGHIGALLNVLNSYPEPDHLEEKAEYRAAIGFLEEIYNLATCKASITKHQ